MLIINSVIKVSVIVYVSFCIPLYANQLVTACGHHDYPPWNWKSGNKLIGVCAEVTEVLFKKLNINVDLTYSSPWKRCLKNIESGKVDINICSFINEKRSRYVKFITPPLGFNEQALFVAKGHEFPYHQLSDLKEKKVGLVFGVSIGQEFDQFLKENNIAVQRLSSYRQAFHMLKLGRLDVIPIGRNSGRLMVENLGLSDNIAELPAPLLQEKQGQLHMAINKLSPLVGVTAKLEQLMEVKGYNQWVESLLLKYTKIYYQEKS